MTDLTVSMKSLGRRRLGQKCSPENYQLHMHKYSSSLSVILPDCMSTIFIVGGRFGGFSRLVACQLFFVGMLN